MKHLTPSEFPNDLLYHRRASEPYRHYLESCGPKTFYINDSEYAWYKRNGGYLSIINFERTNQEPDIASIKKTYDLKHGMAIWVPYSRTEMPKGWRRLWLPTHFKETGFCVLDTPEYYKKWNERARRARKKFVASGLVAEGVTPDVFATAFAHTKVRHGFKDSYVTYYKKMTEIDPSSVRQWIVFDHDRRPLAGLAVHDYSDDHTVHMVAFTSKEAYASQAGTGLIDIWFADSIKKGLKYLSFDQLREKYGPRDQKGYTAFKENFLDYRMSFPTAYFRFF